MLSNAADVGTDTPPQFMTNVKPTTNFKPTAVTCKTIADGSKIQNVVRLITILFKWLTMRFSETYKNIKEI